MDLGRPELLNLAQQLRDAAASAEDPAVDFSASPGMRARLKAAAVTLEVVAGPHDAEVDPSTE